MTDKEKELQAEAISYLRNRIAELEMTVGTLRIFSNEQATCIERLEEKFLSSEEYGKEGLQAYLKLEKENKELKAQIENYKLSEIEAKEIIAEQEAKIEKMKSCVNCRYCINEKCPWQPKGCKMKHWELRR